MAKRSCKRQSCTDFDLWFDEAFNSQRKRCDVLATEKHALFIRFLQNKLEGNCWRNDSTDRFGKKPEILKIGGLEKPLGI